MALTRLGLLALLITISFASVIPHGGEEKEKKTRVVDKPLSDEKHYKGADDIEHNAEFDHDAFLGKEEAESFDKLSPEESQRRLALIYEKIDKDGDGQVTEEELKVWMQYVQNRYILTDTSRQWKEYDLDEAASITWDSYKTRTYGEDLADNADDDADKSDDSYDYKDMLRRDERRWKKADANGDGELSKDEYTHFLHPEDIPHMKDIVVEETLEDIDKDHDGVISLKEYIEDMNGGSDPEDDDDHDEDDDDDMASDREEFTGQLDADGDGFLSRPEIEKWLFADRFEHVGDEVVHLFREADTDKDGKLTKKEVLAKYDLFVGSQATDFGEALTRHDEF